MPTPIENNTASLETVMGKINGVSSEVNTQATQIGEIMTLLEGKTYDSASLQPKVVTPTYEDQVIMADEGYQGLSQVTVKAMEEPAPETCTVIVESYNFNNYNTRHICYTSYENDEIYHNVIIYHPNIHSLPMTLSNVICDTMIVVTTWGGRIDIPGSTASGSAEVIRASSIESGAAYYFSAPNIAGEQATISFGDDD